jgi:multiple sugar transport system permease protein
VLVPIWFIASMAFTTPEYVRAYPKGVLPFIPFSLETMRFFLSSQGIIPGTINSIFVALVTLVLSTLIAAPAGYAISRYLFRGRDVYRLSILAVRAFPVVVLAIPLAVVFINLGIYDSVFSLALMHTALTLPTTILVIGSVFASIPYELEEAAQVFGCSPLQAFRTVVLPLVAPGIAAAAIFTFVMSWNEVFAASILTLQNRTLPAQVLSALSQSSEAYQFAGAFFMMLPALIFIFVIRRYLFNMWGQITK